MSAFCVLGSLITPRASVPAVNADDIDVFSFPKKSAAFTPTAPPVSTKFNIGATKGNGTNINSFNVPFEPSINACNKGIVVFKDSSKDLTAEGAILTYKSDKINKKSLRLSPNKQKSFEVGTFNFGSFFNLFIILIIMLVPSKSFADSIFEASSPSIF